MFGSAKLSNTKVCLCGAFGRILMCENILGTTAVSDVGTRAWTRLDDGDFIDSLNGCVIGQGYLIKRTTDGGLTWFDANQDCPTSYLCDIDKEGLGLDFSSNGNLGLAVGTGGFIARSTDSGATWCRIASPTTSNINAVAFPPWTVLPQDLGLCAPTNTAYFVGGSGMVYRSVDGGATWTSVTIPNETVTLYGVSFATPCAGYVVGTDGKIFTTSDGGQVWRKLTVQGGSSDTFYDVETWGNGSSAIVVGQNGGVYERVGSQFVRQTLGNLTVTEQLRGVEVLNQGVNVRVCGDMGTVLFRDSGVWTRKRSQTNSNISTTKFSDPTHGFAIGTAFDIERYSP